MKFRFALSVVRLLLCLAPFVFFTACHGGAGNGPQGNGEGILGRTADADQHNSRLVCVTQDKSNNLYRGVCYVTVKGLHGDVRADGYKANTVPAWNPKFVQTDGQEASVFNCSVADDLLSNACDIQTTSTLPATFSAGLTLTDTISGAATNLLAQIVVPLTAQLIGRVPSMPDLLIQNAASSSSGTSGRNARMATDVETRREPFGNQRDALPLEGLALSFSTSRYDGSLFLTNGSHIYEYKMRDEMPTLRSIAGLAPIDWQTQTDTPIVGVNTDPFRLNANSISQVLAVDSDEVYALVRDDAAERILHVKRGKPTEVVAVIPKTSHGGDVLGNTLAMYRTRTGEFFFVTSGGVFKWSAEGGVQHFIGTGNFHNPDHPQIYEDPQNSVYIADAKGAAVTKDGHVYIVDTNKKQVILYNGSVNVLYTEDELPQEEKDWNGPTDAPSIAVGAEGDAYLLVGGENRGYARLYHFKGAERKQVYQVSATGKFPARGSKTPLAQFPLVAAPWDTAQAYVGGVTPKGPIFVGPTGVAELDVASGLVETLMTTSTALEKGFSGDTASTAFLNPQTGITWTPAGDCIVGLDFVMKNIVKTCPDQNKVSSVPLSPVNVLGQAYHLVASPEGGIFILVQSFTAPKLYRVDPETGEMSEVSIVIPSPNPGPWTALAAKSNTEFYVAADGNIKLYRTDGTVEMVFALPSNLRRMYPGGLSLGPDGMIYITKFGVIHALWNGAVRPLFGGGPAAFDGGFLHEMNPPGVLGMVQPFAGGIVASSGATLYLFKAVATGADGFPIHTFKLLHPSKVGNADCAVNLVKKFETNDREEYSATTASVCPGQVGGLAVKVIQGMAVFAISRAFGPFGNLFLMGMPL